MNLLFSLVLPVYNVELYIEKCLRSCLEQHDFLFSDFEIILVDDGSPDNSIAIAKRIAKEYPNSKLKFITRINGGLSAARNTGLKYARGKYIWFIDSDDWIANDALSKLSQKLKDNENLEILTFSHQTVHDDGRIVVHRKGCDYTGTGFDHLSKNTFLSAWTCIYSVDYLNKNNFIFKEGMLWEDSEFNLRVYGASKKHCFYSVPLYYYLRRDNSITTKRLSFKMMNSWFIKIDSIVKYYKAIALQKKQRETINRHLASTVIAAVAGLNELPNRERKIFRKKILNNKKKYKRLFSNSGNLKLLISGFLIFYTLPISEQIFSYLMNRTMKKQKNI